MSNVHDSAGMTVSHRSALFAGQLPPSFGIAATIAIAIAITVVKASMHLLKTSDSLLFIQLGRNIVANFCYSSAPVAAGTCAPTWAQQPPGYALIMALTQIIANDSDRLTIWLQATLFSVAALYFCWILYAWHRSSLFLFVTATAALLSPASFGWSRVMLTESLSATIVLLVFAEIARSVHLAQFRIFRISAFLICAMLLRWDLIFLLVPVMVALLCSLGLRRALRIGCMITAICALPYLALMARAVTVGLPPLPSVLAGDYPPGIVRYFQVAALDEKATYLLWNVVTRQYSLINRMELAGHWVSTDFDRASQLIHRLGTTPDDEAVPTSLDDDFSAVAANISRDRFATYFLLPVRRAAIMWWDWLGHPIPASGLGQTAPLKYFFFGYYVIIGVGLLAAALTGNPPSKILAIAGVSFAVGRTAFLVSNPVSCLELRYLDLFVPSFDIIALYGLYGLWSFLKFRTSETHKFIGGPNVEKRKSLHGRRSSGPSTRQRHRFSCRRVLEQSSDW